MRHVFYPFLLLFLFHLVPASGQMVVGSDTLIGNEWIEYGNKYYRFYINEDGIVRVPASTLTNTGINAGDIVGSEVRIYNMGRQVPLIVSTDGVFGNNDYIEFLGKKNRSELDRFLYQRPDEDLLNPYYSLYTDNNPYFLTLQGSETPLRVTTLENDLSGSPEVQSYLWHVQRNVYTNGEFEPYYTLSGGGAVSYSSYMHAEGFARPGENSSTLEIASTNRYNAGPDAQLRLRLASTNLGGHRFVVSINENILDTIYHADLKMSDNSYTIPMSFLADNNQVKVTSLNVSTRQSIVFLELTYPTAVGFASAPQSQITLEAKNNRQQIVIDHSPAERIVYTADGTKRMISTGQSEIVWPASAHNVDLFTTTMEGIRIVDSVVEKVFVDKSSDNTQFVIITHPSLMEMGSASAYAQYKASIAGGGFKANAYSILDIYDEFGYGIERHPQSVRNFVTMMGREWPAAQFIFIIGRAIEYHRSRVPGTWESWFFVPTFGRPGSDNLLAATLWDFVPRYPIGRLAVVEQEDIANYLEKLKQHDQVVNRPQTIADKAWTKNVMHIGGGKTASEQVEFKNTLANIGEILEENEFGAKISFFHKESTNFIDESQSRQIERLLENGVSLLNYLGHSSATTFEFNIPEAQEWNNPGRYPVFSAMGCSAGAIHGQLFSLSDRYVFTKNEGAIAFISGSSSQFANALIRWAQPWYDYLGSEGYYKSVGEANLVGLQQVANSVNINSTDRNIYRFLLEQQTYQGDPSIRLHPAPGPDYLVDRTSVTILPDVLNTKLDSFDIRFKIVNIGRNLHQNVNYNVQLKRGDGHVTDLHNGQIISSTYETEVTLRLPLAIGGKAGLYRLLVKVDPAQEVAELPAPDAEANNDLIDNLGFVGIPFVVVDNLISAVYPPDFSIVTTTVPELIATSSNSFIKRQNIVLEMDTVGTFVSPAFVREKFINHSATLKWSPVNSLIPGKVYYWRVSTDSISPEQGYIWSKRSFLYQPGSRRGWNQSHFHQFTEDDLIAILPDSTKKTFLFDQQLRNFRVLNRFHDVPLGLVPFFFEDGKFIAKLFQTFRNSPVHGFVIAIDSATGNYLMNPPGGLYGSIALPTIPMEGFAYNLTDPQGRQDMINLMENVIPDGHYVFFYTYQHTGFEDYMPEQWATDESTFGKSIFTTIESQYPESQIRTLDTAGSKPYIILYQKGRGIIEEQIAEDADGVISVSFDAGVSASNGTFLSKIIGPASAWHSIEHLISEAPDTNGVRIFSAFALNDQLGDTLWISQNIQESSVDITHIDPKTHPYIQLKYVAEDSVDFTPSLVDFWRVYYEGYPELVINPQDGFVFNKDSLQQGQSMSLSTYIENVSPYDVDSFTVSLKLISADNTTEELVQKVEGVSANSKKQIAFAKTTEAMKGDYQLLMDVNSARSVIENTYVNNIGILPLFVEGDGLNPILDVTFDGQHILDGDLVASRPLIAIRLHDENEYLRLDDTTSFAIYLLYPSETQPRRIAFNQDWVQFTPASGTGQNLATVQMQPILTEDGLYELQVRAIDASGNESGNNEYHISFEVINEESVSHLYNYPNPFSTSTRFVYTLTGTGSPKYYKIQIMSISGKIVREITQDELGPLVVGTHMTDYVWDGTDESGERLAAGTYLYRMVVKNENLEDYKRYDTSRQEEFFKKGWGKLVILR